MGIFRGLLSTSISLLRDDIFSQSDSNQILLTQSCNIELYISIILANFIELLLVMCCIDEGRTPLADYATLRAA